MSNDRRFSNQFYEILQKMDNCSEFLQKLDFLTGEITSCDINSNYLLALGLSDNTVRVLEWKIGLGFVDMFYSPLSFHKYKITSVRFSPKGTMLASASLDGTAVLLDVLKGTKIFTMVQHNKSSIKFCQFTFDCTKIITAADDGIICFWDLLHQRQLRHCRLQENEYDLKSMTVSPDSEYLISIDSADLLKLWFIGDVTNNQPRCILLQRDVHHDNCWCEFSPVKNIIDDLILKLKYNIVTCGGDSLIKIWDLIIQKEQISDSNSNFKCLLKFSKALKKHALDVISIRYDPTGNFIVSTGLDNLAKLWEVQTGKCLKTFHGHKKMVVCAAFSKNSLLLATGSSDKHVIIWDLSQSLTLDSQLLTPCQISSHFTQIDLMNYFTESMDTDQYQKVEFALTQKLNFSSIVNCVQFQSNYELAIAGGEKTVALWEKENNTVLFKNKFISKAYKYGFNCLDISPCGSKIIFCSIDGVVILWDLHLNLTYEMKTPNCTSSLRICKFSPNSKHIGAAGDDQKVYLWDAKSFEFIKVTQKHENSVTALAFTFDSKYLVSTCSGGHLILYSLDQESCTNRINNAHDLGVMSCDFFPNEIPEECAKIYFFSLKQKCTPNYLMATGGKDSLIKLWQIEQSEVLVSEVFSGHGGPINCVKFSSSKPFILASCSSDTTVRIWCLKSKDCLQVLNFHKCAVTTCAFTSDSDALATGSLDKTVLIFKLKGPLYHESKEPNYNSNKLLENWTKSDTAEWLLQMGWKEAADKVLATEIDGRALLMFTSDAIADYLGLKSGSDRKALKLQVFCLKKQSLGFSLNAYNKKKSIPHMFLCPITHDIMMEPVISSDGYVYDKAALTEWFLSRKFISPVTKEYLKSTEFLTYSALKINIYQFIFENDN